MMGSGGKPNYYELLEITPDATQTEVAKAYQKAKQTYDTDNPALYSMFSPEEAKELLKLIDEAYGILGSASSRREYDQSIGSVARPAAQTSSSATTSAAATAPAKTSSAGDARPEPMKINTAVREEVGEVKVIAKPAEDRRSTDTGKTQLSTYKIDKDIESEIAGISDYNGAALEKIRLYKNISLEKMSELTRISRTYLTAVEANDYKNLPAAVFVRGFIVQVSRALGLDEKKVAESYMKLFKAGGGK